MLTAKDNIILCSSIGLSNTLYVFRPEKKNNFFNDFIEIKITIKAGKFFESNHKLEVIERQAVDLKINEMIAG